MQLYDVRNTVIVKKSGLNLRYMRRGRVVLSHTAGHGTSSLLFEYLHSVKNTTLYSPTLFQLFYIIIFRPTPCGVLSTHVKILFLEKRAIVSTLNTSK